MSRNADTIELIAKLARRVLGDRDIGDLIAQLQASTRPQTAAPRRTNTFEDSRAPRGGAGGRRPVSTGIPAEDLKRDNEFRGRGGRGGDRGGRGGEREQRRDNVRAVPRSQAFGAPDRRTEGFTRPATAPSSEQQPKAQGERSNQRRRNNRRPNTEAK